MAPALVEPTLFAQPAADRKAEQAWRSDKRQAAYKEAFQQTASSTNYENEINGTDGHEPAAYPK